MAQEQELQSRLAALVREGQSAFAGSVEDRRELEVVVELLQRALGGTAPGEARVPIGAVGRAAQRGVPMYLLRSLADWSAPLRREDGAKVSRHQGGEPWRYVATTLPGGFWFEIVGASGTPPSATLALVGDGYYRRYVAEEAREEGIAPCVTRVVTAEGGPGFAAHVCVQYEWVRGEEIMAIYQASRAGGMRYVELRRFMRDSKDDPFLLARETPDDDSPLVVVTSRVPQPFAAPYLGAARAYCLGNAPCSAFERGLIAQIAEEDIRLLALDLHG